MPRFTAENARQMGQRGGHATVARHGRGHMAAIGLKGFWRTVNRHWDGDARAYVSYLIQLGLAATDPVPQNGAFEHDRLKMQWRAKISHSHLRPRWKPPAIPDGIGLDELPF